MREVLTGEAPPASTAMTMELWRPWIQSRAGALLEKMQGTETDQMAFAKLAKELIGALETDMGDASDSDGDDTENEEEGDDNPDDDQDGQDDEAQSAMVMIRKIAKIASHWIKMAKRIWARTMALIWMATLTVMRWQMAIHQAATRRGNRRKLTG